VHDALRDALAVEMGELLEQVKILKKNGAARTGGERVLIVADRDAGGGGKLRSSGHEATNVRREHVRPGATGRLSTGGKIEKD